MTTAETTTESGADEFGKVFTLNVRYEVQIDGHLRGWLREEKQGGARDCDLVEEIVSHLDNEHVNVVDAEGEIDFIEDLELDANREGSK